MASESFIKKPFQQKSSFFICDILEKESSTNNSDQQQCVSPALSQTSIDSDRCFSPTNTSSPDLSFHRNGSKPLAASTPSSLSKKSRKARTIFTDKQLQALEDCFDKQKYLSVQDRMDLANKLNLSDTQVKTWYQNRRTKWKRQSSVGYELLTEANNCAAVQQMLMGGHPYWSAFLKTYLQNTTTPPMFRIYPPSAENQFPTVTLPTSSSSNMPGFPSVLCR